MGATDIQVENREQEMEWLRRELQRLAGEAQRLSAWITEAEATLKRVQEMPENARAMEKQAAIERAVQNDALAYKVGAAARVLGISYETLRREIVRKKIFRTAGLKLISRNELLRYLDEETQIARRKRRSDAGKPRKGQKRPPTAERGD